MAKYRVLISPATDPANFSAELPITSVAVTETLNDSGSATVSLPLRIEDPETLATVTEANLDTATTLVWVEREGILIWGGILWGISGSVEGNVLTLSASGFHSYVRRRIMRIRASYSGQDQLAIARSLIQLVEVVNGSLGIIGTSDTNVSGRTRVRLYNAWDRKSFGEAIEDLAAVEFGFDFYYDVAYGDDGVTPTVEFRTTFPALGFQTNYVFDINSNAEALSFSRDGSRRTNEVDALGSGEGPLKRVQTRTNTAALASEPLLQSVISVSDVNTDPSLSIHAGRSLSRGSASAVQYTIKVDPAGTPPHTAYRVGDIVELRADYGYLDDSGSYRIVEKTVAAEGGGEAVTLTLTSLALFADVT
jgi:hypothetical protein